MRTCCLLMILSCSLTTALSGLEKDEQEMNYLFNTKEKVVPGHATTIIIAKAKEKALPFIIVGRPMEGELTILTPDDKDMLRLTRKDNMAASLLGYGDLEGEFKIDFTTYSGGWPADKQLGIELYKEKPTWILSVDEISDFKYQKKRVDKKKRGGSSGGEGNIHIGTINGSLKITDSIRIPIEHKATIVLTDPKSSMKMNEKGPPTTVYTNARIDFRMPLKLKGSQLGWAGVDTVEMDVTWVGWADMKKSSDKMFKDNLPKINLDATR